jgi:hypothetical protein
MSHANSPTQSHTTGHHHHVHQHHSISPKPKPSHHSPSHSHSHSHSPRRPPNPPRSQSYKTPLQITCSINFADTSTCSSTTLCQTFPSSSNSSASFASIASISCPYPNHSFRASFNHLYSFFRTATLPKQSIDDGLSSTNGLSDG